MLYFIMGLFAVLYFLPGVLFACSDYRVGCVVYGLYKPRTFTFYLKQVSNFLSNVFLVTGVFVLGIFLHLVVLRVFYKILHLLKKELGLRRKCFEICIEQVQVRQRRDEASAKFWLEISFFLARTKGEYKEVSLRSRKGYNLPQRCQEKISQIMN